VSGQLQGLSLPAWSWAGSGRIPLPFEFSPEKLVYGGEALGYYQGRPVLVPRALPGERLEVEPVRVAKGVVHARPLRILEPAPQRVVPPCPYFGRCGGCQLQHLSSAHQASWKKEILRETLRRIGKIPWDGEVELHAGPPWNYRNQARLKVARQADGRVVVGFFEADSHRLCPVDACLILSPRLHAIIKDLRREEWSVPLSGCLEIELLANDGDECVMLTMRGNMEGHDGETLARMCLARLPGVSSVAIERGQAHQVFGEPALIYQVGEFRYRISPGSFFQASRFLLPEFVARVTERQSGDMALDLFAGVGLFTLPLGQRFTQVIAVEGNSKSASDLAASAQAHALENIRIAREPVFDFLRRLAQTDAGLAVLDPPRAGVDVGTLKILIRLRPRRIHYVSCSPPTLARDLRYLTERGYRLDSIELFDFFPQTYHIECLARLSRSDLPNSS